jgi:hypothetical protein
MAVSRHVFLPSILFSTRMAGTAQTGAVLSVVPLLGLARELAVLFLPMQPRSQFRADLERSLLAAARQQNAQAVLASFAAGASLTSPRPDVFERRWVIGATAAAISSAVSIAGVVAYMIYRRGGRAA